MQQERLVVIGGTAAGLSAASAARRLKKDLSVTVYEKTGYISYGSCGLPYYIGGLVEQPEDLVTFTPEQLAQSRSITVHIHHEVTQIDRLHKLVTVRNLDTGTQFEAPYDKLVIATGASANMPNFSGAEKAGVFTVRHVEDGIAIRNELEHCHKQIVIIGAGYIGLEMAAELAASGHSVTILEAMPSLLPSQPAEYADLVRNALTSNGVRLETGVNVLGFAGSERVCSVQTTLGEYPADIVIVSAGVHPNSGLAAQASLPLGLRNAIVVNDMMRTADPDIYACGDCAETFLMIDHSPAYIPLGTTANKQGKIAGMNIGGRTQHFRGVLGSQITKVFDLYLGSIGLTEAAAHAHGFDCASCSITKSDRASYYPGGVDTRLTLVFEKKTGRLLGAAAIGGESVSGRLNVLAAAITAEMTLEQLNTVDFVYAPPVAPVYDPILIAASQAIKRI